MKSSHSGDVSGQNEDSSMGDSDSVLGKLFFSSKISALSPGSTYDASIRYEASLFFLHSNPLHTTPQQYYSFSTILYSTPLRYYSFSTILHSTPLHYDIILSPLHSTPHHSTTIEFSFQSSPLHSKSSITSLAQDCFSPFLSHNAV